MSLRNSGSNYFSTILDNMAIESTFQYEKNIVELQLQLDTTKLQSSTQLAKEKAKYIKEIEKIGTLTENDNNIINELLGV